MFSIFSLFSVFSVLFMSTFLQFFGSPFLKTTFIFWGLLFGCFVAAVSSYTAHSPRDKTTCWAEEDAPCIGGFANAEEDKQYELEVPPNCVSNDQPAVPRRSPSIGFSRL